jgi:hypothetical protein
MKMSKHLLLNVGVNVCALEADAPQGEESQKHSYELFCC